MDAALHKPLYRELEQLIEREIELFPSQWDGNGERKTADASILSWVIDSIITLGLRPGDKIIDLGSGYGVPLAAFSLMGLRPYGVEIAADCFRASHQLIHNPPVRSEAQRFSPQVWNADYFSEEFKDLRFSDGVTPGEMDAFYCFAYDDYNDDVGNRHFRRVPREIAKIARPGTPIVIAVWDGGDPSVWVERVTSGKTTISYMSAEDAVKNIPRPPVDSQSQA